MSLLLMNLMALMQFEVSLMLVYCMLLRVSSRVKVKVWLVMVVHIRTYISCYSWQCATHPHGTVFAPRFHL